MTEQPPPSALRAARLARGWSQTDAARELAALGRSRGAPVAAAASLKTLLSRWENGHVVPEPQYRELLGELLSRTAAELGFDDPSTGAGIAGLRAAVAAAAAVDDDVLELWRQQLDVARRLDDEVGAAGAAGVVRAQVEQLATTLDHTLVPRARSGIAAVLAAAASLAGHQSLDMAEHDVAWRRFGQARAAAATAGLPVAGAEAVAGLAAVLVDAGEPRAALTLLTAEQPPGPVAAQVRWEAALGQARAAAGEDSGARAAFAAAQEAWPGVTVDMAEPPTIAVELADLHRWHAHGLVALGDEAAVPSLQQALADRQPSARHRAALHADLAVALHHSSPASAAEHHRAARELAVRIGSARITARLRGSAR